MLFCSGKKGGKVIINGTEIIEIGGAFSIVRGEVKSWYVNPYTARRPDQNCNISSWDGFFLNDSNPNSSYSFVPISDFNNCGTKNYNLSLNSGAPFGDVFLGIIPAGFTFKPWKCQLLITDSNNQQVLKRDYEIGQCPNLKVECFEGCPPGTVECKCKSYPGYCCISCSSIAQQISNLKNNLRGRNSG